MNTRLQELIEQAGTDTSGKWMSVDNAEKFLQLVLADCTEIIESWAEDDFAINGIAIEILDHFDMELPEDDLS